MYLPKRLTVVLSPTSVRFNLFDSVIYSMQINLHGHVYCVLKHVCRLLMEMSCCQLVSSELCPVLMHQKRIQIDVSLAASCCICL